MKTKIICLLFLLPLLQCHAQFLKRLGNKAANAAATTTECKVEEKTEKKTGEAIDKVLDPQNSDGDNKKNLALSEFRAMAVKTELVRKFELNGDNL